MKALQENNLVCTRMGAYKPRTNPYSFQGHGAKCLPYVFELAGKYGIKVIAMEITHETHLDEIRRALETSGHPTGVMLQIGTRNTQNFELLKIVGRQKIFPVLLKRGFGITLEESLNAAEYMASEGNSKIVFGLRGMKTNYGDPHRNLVDFAHIPVVKRLTRMPVCIDFRGNARSRCRRHFGYISHHCPRHYCRCQHGFSGFSPRTQPGIGGRRPGVIVKRAAVFRARYPYCPRSLPKTTRIGEKSGVSLVH